MMNASRTIAAALAAAAILTANAASALSRAVYVHNDGDSPIWSIEISHIDDPVYREDMLGLSTLAAGEGRWLEPVYDDGYCRFDLRITYTSGQQVQMWDVNLCEAVSLSTDNYGYTDISY